MKSRRLVPVLLALLPAAGAAQPAKVLDLADDAAMNGLVRRVYGADGDGQFGVPVAGGLDMDGDGFADYAIALMTADPLGRMDAGEVVLVFGDGTFSGTVDASDVDNPGVLRILGDQDRETAGSEIWMADVTGDGLGDLLICRQNFSPSGTRLGAGALTVIAGTAALAAHAQTLQPIDLRSPAGGLPVTTIVGVAEGDRFCIWTRTGDVTGDGVDDLVVGADQEDGLGQNHRGALYVFQGGDWLAAGGTLSLTDLRAGALKNRVAHVALPSGANEFHLGATCQIADLDGNGLGEVLGAAALSRAGAFLGPYPAPPSPHHFAGGAPGGRLYVLWDDNFTPPWPEVLEINLANPPGSRTVIRGGNRNIRFGEEILGGLDYDGDGEPELFVGDLVADETAAHDRLNSGAGYVFYDAPLLRGLDFNLDSPPPQVAFSTILGPSAHAIGADTAAHADFDGDGLGDLAFCSPKAAPAGRVSAGAVHVLRGRIGGWPAEIDTAALPPTSAVRVTEIRGAHGTSGSDEGDVLCYSGAAGDVDGDGLEDLLVNEMEGSGPAGDDVGNLLAIDGTVLFAIFRDGFESGDTTAWSAAVP